MTSPYHHNQGVGVETSIWSVDRAPPTTAVRAATTANIADLTAASVSQDGVTLTAGQRLLVKDQGTTTENGIYAVGTVTSGVAPLTRVSPMSDDEDVPPGLIIYVEAGTANGGKFQYVTNTGTITVGTTGLTFSALVGSVPAALASTATGNGASLVGVEDAAGNFAGTTVEAVLAEIISDYAATTASNGASKIGFQDVGAFTTAADVEAALAELYQHTLSAQAQLNIPLTSFVDPDGDPLVKFADGASAVPGWNLADSEAFGIRWNNHATPNLVLTQITMPQDLDDTAAIVVHWLASKTGATVGDAVTFTCTAFFHTVGALHDADANAGGVSGAMTGDATAKTVQEVTLSIAAGDVPPSPSSLSLTFKPTDGTLGTDDVIVEAVWIEYKRKLLTS